MYKLKATHIVTIAAYIAVALLVFPWHVQIYLPSFETIVWLALFLLLTITVLSKNKVTIQQVALVIVGIIYIGVGFYYMNVTRALDDGLFWSLLVFVCIWMTDISAYFSGWAVGKRLLWPAISPKKTVEGAIGAVIFTVGTALVFSLYAPHLLSIWQAIILGVSISIVAQVGDFIQSAYKRIAGVKDSGALFPGHGGVLDRCDSWIIVFPFVHICHLLPITT